MTVTVASTDTETGARRHVQLREPEGWARAVFAEFDDDAKWIYLLGGIDPDTGRPEYGRTVYRLYLDEVAAPIRVPPELASSHARVLSTRIWKSTKLGRRDWSEAWVGMACLYMARNPVG